MTGRRHICCAGFLFISAGLDPSDTHFPFDTFGCRVYTCYKSKADLNGGSDMDLEKLLVFAGMSEDLPGNDRLSRLIAKTSVLLQDDELDESEMELVQAARGSEAARKGDASEKDRS